MSHTFIHFLHDAGAAAWFGGSLMGATSLNAAAAELDDPRQRARASTAGWSRWAPVNAAAVGAHLIGGAGLLLTDSHRVATQEGVLLRKVLGYSLAMLVFMCLLVALQGSFVLGWMVP